MPLEFGIDHRHNFLFARRTEPRYSLTATRGKRLARAILRIEQDQLGCPPAVDLHSLVDNSHPPFRNQPQGQRIESMFDPEDALGEPRLIITGMDRHHRLPDYRSAIDLRAHEMHRAARKA